MYKNRHDELKEISNFILNDSHQVFLYETHAGYGNTAFISRVQYVMRSTASIQFLYAELSTKETNPLHAITKNIVCNNGQLYQQMQWFTDEELGVRKSPLTASIIKDLTQSEVISSLFDEKSTIPIYAGFYQNRLKEIFYKLLDSILKQKKVVVWVDNAQLIDEESIYELKTLLNYKNVKLILFKSGESTNFDKLYFETKYNYSYIESTFPEPDIHYVKKLGELYKKELSNHDAELVLFKAQKDIRKILYYLRAPSTELIISTPEQQIANLMYLYNDYLDLDSLYLVLSYTPYKHVITLQELQQMISNLEQSALLKSITYIEDKKIYYCISANYKPNIGLADELVLKKAILSYYKQAQSLSYSHLIRAREYAKKQNDKISMQRFSISIVEEALHMGYDIDEEIIDDVKGYPLPYTQLLIATLLFCKARYVETRKILEQYSVLQPLNRAQSVMYAIVLNRCREHSMAQIKLTSLLKTSIDKDEMTILASFLISNHIHNNKRNDAINVYENYKDKLIGSCKYPYFLRNAATLFNFEKAYELRNSAKILFKENLDYFGYYGTTINMTAYYLKKYPITYTINEIQLAFEGMQQFSANQIHLAANNLGVCHLMNDDYTEAIKYFELSRNVAKTIMPITYATINLSALYLKYGNYQEAQDILNQLYKRVSSTSIPRLKVRYFIQRAFVAYAIGDENQVNRDCTQAAKYLESVPNSDCSKVMQSLSKNICNHIIYTPDMWEKLYIPCFLEYWTINSIDILSDQILST